MNGSTSTTVIGSNESRQRNYSSNSEENQQHGNKVVIAQCRRNKEVSAKQNSTTNNETEESDTEEKLLSVSCRSGKLGAAYYTLQTGELFILDEIVDRAPDFQIFNSLFHQVDPVRIILDGKCQGAFVTAVKATVFADSSSQGRCRLNFITSKDYSFEACKRRIFSLSLPNEPEDSTEDERILFLRTVLDFNQIQTVHALGALLRYLDVNWANLNLDLQSKPQFLTLKKISLADIVSIDVDTYRGLQIFSTVSHPSGFKQGTQGSSKETLSLFYIFNKCSSKVGRSRMRVLMQHPSKDLSLLHSRQQVIAYFLQSGNDAIVKNICSSMRFIKNVHGILAKIKALSAKPYQWKSLYNTIYNAVLICEMCENAGKESDFLQQLALRDNNKLYEMALYMNRIIDFDLSKSEGKFTVKAGVDPELDLKKQTMASLHTLMSETAKVELDRLPLYIEECTMLYMPHLGYLLGVKAWDTNLTMDQKELPNMKFMFQNNDYIHYKSKGCEELDMMIGDTYPEIVSLEARLMLRLAGAVLRELHTLTALIDNLAELDCLIAMSKVCKEMNFVRPTLTRERVIRIRRGRHPLHELTRDTFVPNDTDSSEEAGFVKVLTGPNSSGKSVYMKQIGLIVYLAHIGSYVPAESATIGILDHIFTRIQTTECVANHMSAFLIDLKQMSAALRAGGEGSLVLCDEAGAGSGRGDGLALAAAALAAWAARAHHVLLASHHRLHALLPPHLPLTYLRFEHIIQDGAPVFLYRLCSGAASSSFAHEVALASGLPTQVVNRARTVLEHVKENKVPPANKRILNQLKNFTEIIKAELLKEDI